MRFAVLQALQRIQLRWPSESPKIFEKLLAVSFDLKRGGFEVESKSTEGVDICLVRNGMKYAVEVKTTSGSCVAFQDKDVEGLLEKQHRDGYIPCVAALRVDLLEDWVIANATRLVADQYTPARLSLDSIPELESIVRINFERALMELLDSILSPPSGSPLSFLADVLAKESS